MDASRQFMWNIGESPLFSAGVLVSLAVFTLGFLFRFMRWGKGRRNIPRLPEPRRLLGVLRTVLVDNGLLGRTPRIVHRSIFYGAFVLFLGSALVGLDMHFGTRILHGWRYLCFTLVLDIAGASVAFGLTLAARKRYVLRPPRLETGPGDGLVLGLLAVIVFTGFILEGSRVAATADPFKAWAPVGAAFGMLLKSLFGVDGARHVHHFLWYLHAALVLLLIALVPWTKLLHTVAVPVHVYLARPVTRRGSLPAPVDKDLPGTGSVRDSSIRALIELDACVRCGRCRKHCAMAEDGRSYSPIDLLRNLKSLVREGRWNEPLLGSAIREEALWACTGCRACEERCPMNGEHVLRIVELRRRAVSTGNVPPSVRAKLHEAGRSCEAGEVPKRADVYIWPGCHDSSKTSDGALSSFTELLGRAGVSFAVLSPPACCGSAARRLGDEVLFEKLACANREYLASLPRAPIVTVCPHCLNTLSNEYGRALTDPPIIHHTTFLERLFRENRLSLPEREKAKVVFHDPCFLGRYGGEYEAPRKLLERASGIDLLEMKHSRNRSACCGSGGASVPDEVVRVGAEERLKHALKVEAEMVVTACPYCFLSLAAAALELPAQKRPQVLDIAEFMNQGAKNVPLRS